MDTESYFRRLEQNDSARVLSLLLTCALTTRLQDIIKKEHKNKILKI